MTNQDIVTIRDRELPAVEPAGLPGIPPLLARLYLARGVTESAGLDYQLGALPKPDQLPGIAAAADALAQTITQGQRILVVGDFDADGATSTALAVRALRAMGASDVDYLVPNRFEFGYGLSAPLVAVAETFKPDLILTVDNGVSANTGVEAANAVGIAVVVTDHHLPGDTLPNALAIVNPQLDPSAFPGRHLAGVGVCFYTMLATRSALREKGWFDASRAQPNLAELLDLVALGTIADVVPLDAVNRLLVDQGLRRIRGGVGCPGINALLRAAGRDPAMACAMDMGFAAAPRLNAAGRIDDMGIGIELLLSDSDTQAQQKATALEALNHERRSLEQQMRASAIVDIEASIKAADGQLAPVLCLYNEAWHQGVVGIVAGRLKDHFKRPVIAFAPGEHGELKGSGRSVPGVHMRDLIEAIDTRTQGEVIDRFGGHAMAAGLQLTAAQLPAFRAALAAIAADWVGGALDTETLWTDGVLPHDAYSLDTARLLRYAGPWGAGFPEPLFRDHFVIQSKRVVGERHLKLCVVPDHGAGPAIDAIAFNALDRGWDQLGARVQGVFRLDVNAFRGREQLQLVFDYLAAA